MLSEADAHTAKALAQIIKGEGHSEAMTQAARILAALALHTHTNQTAEVNHVLKYLTRGQFDPNLRWEAPDLSSDAVVNRGQTLGRLQAMAQAAAFVAALAKATHTHNNAIVQQLLHYLVGGTFDPDKTWSPPEVAPLKLGTVRPRSLKKFSDSDRNITVRYMITPSGESRGELVRVEMRRSDATNLIHCTSPDMKGLVLAKQFLGDCLAQLPELIGKMYGYTNDDVGVTVERIDWPDGHSSR